MEQKMRVNKINLFDLIVADVNRYRTIFRLTGSYGITIVFQPRFIAVLLIRLARSFHVVGIPIIPRIISIILFIFFGIEYGLQCDIGPGLILPHPQGIVIGANCIGRNAIIYHRVTLGAKKMDPIWNSNKRPFVGDDVLLGSGSVVLGPVKIGDRVQIGANTVVFTNIADDMNVVGQPALIKERR